MSYLLVSERETNKNLKVLSKFRKTRTCNWKKKLNIADMIFGKSGFLKYPDSKV